MQSDLPSSSPPAGSFTDKALMALVGAGFVAGILGFLWFAFLLRVSPVEPNSVSGQIEAFRNHDHIVYVRPLEKAAFFALTFGGIGAVVIIGGIFHARLNAAWYRRPMLETLIGAPLIALMLVAIIALSTNGDIPFGWFGL